MLKRTLITLTMLHGVAALAAVDLNRATAAELESIKGLGPATSEKILQMRKQARFKDWNDFVTRVLGVGDIKAGRFSGAGLTIDGAPFPRPGKPGKAKTTAQ